MNAGRRTEYVSTHMHVVFVLEVMQEFGRSQHVPIVFSFSFLLVERSLNETTTPLDTPACLQPSAWVVEPFFMLASVFCSLSWSRVAPMPARLPWWESPCCQFFFFMKHNVFRGR